MSGAVALQYRRSPDGGVAEPRGLGSFCLNWIPLPLHSVRD